MKNNSHNSLFLLKRQILDELKKIPKKNKHKYTCDWLKLIQYAQKDDYDNFDF